MSSLLARCSIVPSQDWKTKTVGVPKVADPHRKSFGWVVNFTVPCSQIPSIAGNAEELSSWQSAPGIRLDIYDYHCKYSTYFIPGGFVSAALSATFLLILTILLYTI